MPHLWFETVQKKMPRLNLRSSDGTTGGGIYDIVVQNSLQSVFTGIYRNLQGFTEIYRFWQRFTGFDRDLQILTEIYRKILSDSMCPTLCIRFCLPDSLCQSLSDNFGLSDLVCQILPCQIFVCQISVCSILSDILSDSVRCCLTPALRSPSAVTWLTVYGG